VNVGQRVPVQHQQIRELSAFDRADVLLQPQRLGAKQRRHAQRFMRRETARLQIPDLPLDLDLLRSVLG